MKSEVKRRVLTGLGLGFLLFGFGSYFVFPLDVIYRTVNVVSTRVSSDGHQFSVIQWWNGFDFYSTFFLIGSLKATNSQDMFKFVVIHGDDKKLWNCHLRINEESHEVEVRTWFRSLGTYNWVTETYMSHGSEHPVVPGIGVWPGYGDEIQRKRKELDRH